DNGKSVPSLLPVSIVLDTGWNQIANPFAFRVSMNSVSPSGNVSNLYFYDGESPYVPNVNVLEPWEGYFIENRSGEQVVLQVAPVEASPSVPKQNEQTLSRSDFILQISAELEQSSLKDVYNYVGFIEGALPGDDILDQREPPSIGDVVQLSIEDGRSYLSNFKPLPGEGEQWNLSISSTIPNRRVNVKLAEYGSRPERFDIYVLDRDDFNAIPVLNSRFTLNLRDTRRSLKLIIGTKEYAEMNNEGIPLVPLAYTLEQNFPNPFNPSTTIRYALNKRSDVSLSIYNLLGQKVKTLVSGEQITGTYSVVWDGVTESGSGAASGVYLYQLRAGEYRASKKLLLLR
ncbi:T9SS type A sorting domain-containing protein, partial [Sphingobacteriales bacterium CHB3]|nr:T9SS type A sorting domain-containing protein [Sphingobacteriales bacterium CHB3]